MRRLLGGLLMGVGILLAGASGLCSMFVIVVGVSGARSGGLADMLVSGLPILLLWGGIPFLLGLGLFYGGRRLARRDDTLETLE